MTGDPEDRELDEYMAGDSPLSRDYRALGREEPHPALDAQIRSAAAAAVKRRKARRPTLWWLRPAALAATVVLAVSVVLRSNVQPTAVSQAPRPSGTPVVTVNLRRGVTDSQPAAASPAEPPALGVPEPAPAIARQQAARPVDEAVTAPKANEDLRDVPMAVASVDAAPTAAAEAEQASPVPDPAVVARALAAIHARIDTADKGLSAGQGIGALRSATVGRDAADARLRAILALESSGKTDELPVALVQFVRDFPDDPVSALVQAEPH